MDREQSLEKTSLAYRIENNQLITGAQQRFYASDLCKEARELLQALANSPDYNTDPSPLINDPVSFVERHIQHLSMYPKTNLHVYISNLKIMTSAKRSKPAN